MSKKSFKLPKSFLNSLGEFSKGYFLVTVNDNNEFETFFNYPDSLTELALMNFVDIQSTTLQEVVRIRTIEKMAGEEESGEETTQE